MKNLLIVLSALVLFAAACGDDSGGSSDSALAQALADEVVDDTEGDALTTDRDEAECFAGRVVGEIGEDRMNELGVTVESIPEIDEVGFTEAEIDTIVDATFDCIDVKAAFVEDLSEDETVSADEATCVVDELGEDRLREFAKAGFSGAEEDTEELFSAVFEAYGACDVPIG